MGLVQNLKRTLTNWADRTLVELSCLYIKQVAKQTLKKQDNSSPMGFSMNPLTQEDQHTTIATSSADTSEKITMMETEEIVLATRQWASDKIKEYNRQGVDRIWDSFAIMAEFDEWFDPEPDLEILSLDEITEDEYDNYVDDRNQLR